MLIVAVSFFVSTLRVGPGEVSSAPKLEDFDRFVNSASLGVVVVGILIVSRQELPAIMVLLHSLMTLIKLRLLWLLYF